MGHETPLVGKHESRTTITIRLKSHLFPLAFQQGVLETETGLLSEEPPLSDWPAECHHVMEMTGGPLELGEGRRAAARLQTRTIVSLCSWRACSLKPRSNNGRFVEPKTGVYEFWGVGGFGPAKPAARETFFELVHYLSDCVATLLAMVFWQCDLYLEILVAPTTKWWNRSSQEWLSFWLNNMSKKSYMK